MFLVVIVNASYERRCNVMCFALRGATSVFNFETVVTLGEIWVAGSDKKVQIFGPICEYFTVMSWEQNVNELTCVTF